MHNKGQALMHNKGQARGIFQQHVPNNKGRTLAHGQVGVPNLLGTGYLERLAGELLSYQIT